MIVALVSSIVAMKTNHGLSERWLSVSSRSGDIGDAGGSAYSSDEPSMRSTKANRTRPIADALAKQRTERRRIEIVRKLQMMRDGGISDRHPSMKATMEELAKDPDIQTELRNSRTYVLRTRDTAEDGFQLTQYQFESGGAVSLKTVSRLDPNGFPLRSKIFDGQNNEIFKVSYGYRRSDGMLAEERVFDSRDRPLDPQGFEIPFRRIVHTSNAVDGSLESKVVDLEASRLPPEMDVGFKNPFLQE